ncbi:CLUMA_CG004163, isoform A [Clunio marinus]|uniref:CLUMA_CG004163, isoform A n=1 Tax=Clunio marinus TaxID=568069 RepID=A0A1J1HR15_9DIPT|nr:CLUMA_CG004163, isoform A [Clunio marinus]
MFSDDNSDIMEGFICPICKSDQKKLESLLQHFEDKHSEEKDLVQTFRDVFKIAKKKILNLDESQLSKTFDSTLKPNKSFNQLEFVEDNQDIGLVKDHIEYFTAIRNPRLERFATETNKLIIRLNKLLTNRPQDPQQIKLHEQNLVPWIDGKLVKLCPSCAKSFFLTRRQHHCRICGSVMCNECSNFLSIDDSFSIINPSYEKSKPNSSEEIILKEPEDSIRLCSHCLHLLENRKQMQDSRSVRPPIYNLYEKLEKIKKDVAPDLIMYEKIITSLYDGNSVYTLADAGALRGKIGHSAEILDDLSKKILGQKCAKGSREEALQKSIRLAAIKFIKENMLTLPPIPLEEEIKKIQQKRITEFNQKIERDRRLAQEAFERYDLSGNAGFPATSRTTGSAMTSVDNWSGYQQQTNTCDPLVEQINIIKGYIKQARDAMRFEEIATLEQNLSELQHEYWLRSQQKE